MPLKADDIIEELLAAFPHQRPADLSELAESPYREEPKAVQLEFAALTDWTAITSEYVDSAPDDWASALSFFTPAAARFYLPAYLRADLRGELDRVTPSFTLMTGFDSHSRNREIRGTAAGTWTQWARERWDTLSAAQVLAVAHYLEFVIERDGEQVSRPQKEALEFYWRPRANALASGIRQ